MVVLEVNDMGRSIEFYRRLGLELPDAAPERPFMVHRMPSGVSLLFTSGFASRYDPSWVRPGPGYQQMLEFYVGDDESVDQKWAELTGAGYHGRMSPVQTVGPYAAMVDDPDGNVILLTSDVAGSPSAT
jgi:predicted lactoylglutathione lyase